MYLEKRNKIMNTQERVFRKTTIEETFIGSGVYEDTVERVLVRAKVLKLTPAGVEEVFITTRKDFLENFSSFNLQDYLEDVKENNLTVFFYEKDGKYTQAGPVDPEVLLEAGYVEVSAEELEAEASAAEKAAENKKRVLEAQELTQQFNDFVEKYNKVKDELYQVNIIEDDVEELEKKIEKFSTFDMKEKVENMKEKVEILNQEIDSRYEALEKVLPSEIFDKIEDLKEKYDIFNANDLCTVVTVEDMKKIVGGSFMKYEEIEEECETHDIMKDVIAEIEAEASIEIEEIEKKEREEEKNAIFSFIREDTIDLLRILVLNKYDEFETRYSFNSNIKNLLEEGDKRIVALSAKNYEYLHNICDNCCNDDEDGCSDGQSLIDCAYESVISDADYYEDIYLHNRW